MMIESKGSHLPLSEGQTDPRRLMLVLIANGLLRVANSASGALIGFYLARLAISGRGVDAALLGVLGLVVNLAELSAAVPFGLLADRFSPRLLLVGSGLLGAVATQLFGMSGVVAIFLLSRTMEGIAAGASGPLLLAHFSDITQDAPLLRGRVMGVFELSVLAGLALGSLVGGVLWDSVHTLAFSLLAVAYLVVAGLFYLGVKPEAKGHIQPANVLGGFRRALLDPALRQLAPAWLAINAVIGLWLTHVGYQLSGPKVVGQFLVGNFSASQVGIILLGYAIVFGIGVTGWGFILGRVPRMIALRINLIAMFLVCVCLYLLNTSATWTAGARIGLLVITSLTIMIESGFTPAALILLADIAGKKDGRGAAMGIYTLLLGLGNALGAALGGLFARDMAFNGLIFGTLGLASVAFFSLIWIPQEQSRMH